MSLTLGRALTNHRRWLTPRRHGLYIDEDHLRPANSLVLPDRRDTFEEVNSIRLVLQQQFLVEPVSCPLLAEDYTNKTKVKDKPGVRSRRVDRSSPRLPAFGNVARVALWGASRFGATGRGWSEFWLKGWLGSYLAGEGQADRLRRMYSG